MGSSKTRSGQRSRELRRRVVLPALLRTGPRWNETCILNMSSRGLMIHSPRAVPEGSLIELRRGEHSIVARVVWCDGPRLGLRSEERLPVEEIMSMGQSHALQLVAMGREPREPRERRRRSHAMALDARLCGRALEFVGVVTIAASLAIGAWAMVERALTSPLDRVTAALDAHP
jgi:hypothetical protein